MKRRLIVHVGMGKTGSSSIQKTLRMARLSLENQGVKYLGLMLEHLELPISYAWHEVSGWRNYIAMDRGQASRELAHAFQFADDNLSEKIHTLIWSNESLFDRFEDVQFALQAISERFEIQVVGYIRRPDSWITSAYLQWGIKHKTYRGPLKPFRAWVSDKPYVVSPKVDAWTRLADNATFYNFDSIRDVSSQFVTEVLSLPADIAPSIRENDTPPPEALALFAYHNSLSEGQVLPDELEPLLKQAGLYRKMQQSRPFNNLLPSENDVADYVELQKAEIERINAIFEVVGQPIFDLTSLRFKDYSNTPLDTNRALLRLIVHLSNEIEQLKQKVNARGHVE